MTDKERLKMIKHDFEERSQYGGFIDDNDTNWLIKQAEKAEQLQKTNTKLNHEIGAYSGKIASIAEKLLILEKEMLGKKK